MLIPKGRNKIFLFLLCFLPFLIVLTFFLSPYFLNYFKAWYLGTNVPNYTFIIEKNIPLLTSDGIHLYQNIYRPNSKKKFPVILSRTPYGKDHPDLYYEQMGEFFAGQGFIFVVQDVRGKEPSEGVFYPHRNDSRDGVETVQWVAQQQWSNQKIALFGFSYVGLTAWQASSQNTPFIYTIIPWFTSSNPYKLWHDEGVLYLRPFLYWMSTYSGNSTKSFSLNQIEKALENKNLKELDEIVTKNPIQAYRDFLNHPLYDSFWKSFFTPIETSSLDVPVLLGTGWFDPFLKTTINDFNTLKSSSKNSLRQQSSLVIGPWGHIPTQPLENLAISTDGKFISCFPLILRWCQRWLNLEDSLIFSPVSFYLMGMNVWVKTNEWPPSQAKTFKFYLGEENKLTFQSKQKINRWQLNFNPNEYVPSIGGHMLYGDNKEGPQNQDFLKTRTDILMWTSPPFIEQTNLVGAPRLNFEIEFQSQSIDLMLKLIDVAPDGSTKLITDGYHRLNQPLNSRQSLTLMDTAYTIEKNHHLQLAIAPSDFPAHAPNPDLQNLKEVSFLIRNSFDSFSHLELQFFSLQE